MDGIILGNAGSFYSQYSIKRATGAHRLATYLRQHGYEIDVVDYSTYFEEDILYQYIISLISSKTKFIGISGSFFAGASMFVSLSKRLKLKYPNLLLVVGSQNLENISKLHADYYVVGYGEKVLLEILQGNTIKTQSVSCLDPLRGGYDQIPNVVHALHDYPSFPMKDLSIDFVEEDYLLPNESLALECSRGCIFRCKFCHYPILGVRDDHTIDAKLFADNLQRNYDRFGITNYTISDETFNDYPEKIKKYADVVEKLPFKVSFGGYIRADLMTSNKRDDLEHLARMNFNTHFYGIESFNEPSAKAIGKGGDPERIKDGLLKAKEYLTSTTGFYNGCISLIIGLPYESEESVDNSYSWLRKYWAPTNSISIHPLFIPNMYDKKSTLSSDYEKYGYKKRNLEDVWKNNGIDLENISDQTLKTFIEFFMMKPSSDLGVVWENEHFNSYTALKKAAEIHIEHLPHFSEQPFLMNEWLGLGYKKEDMNKPFKELGGIAPPIDKVKSFIDNYITKKLS